MGSDRISAFKSTLNILLLFSEDQMMNLPIDEILPTPDALHHIVEDFLTDWTAPIR